MTAPHETPEKLTDWFPADVKPRHRGVYQTRNRDTGVISYNRWDGKRWHWGNESRDVAARTSDPKLDPDDLKPWRGLKQKPIAPLQPGESRQIGASMFEVHFTEGPDRPYADD
ncbi:MULTISPECIES: hypothetical protein [Burkholderia]|uniref:Uncharacterized protein n=1 Tax=Burkholderia aenigmatica TaxID=2015348 RepID=A0ABY6XXT6_9BURK|nr:MULTISPECIES: hypothetical protein [Burkholderia]VWD01491.1 hypothetical protein BLA17378_05269 [Burkholderia aenigmatica]